MANGAVIAPYPLFHGFYPDGRPLNGGQLHTYQGGTLPPAADTPAAQVPYTEGTFTLMLLGCTEVVYGTAEYGKLGRMVTLHVPYLVGESNGPSLILQGFPAEIMMHNGVSVPVHALNHGLGTIGTVLVGTMSWPVWPTGDPAVDWSPTGEKGLKASALSYLLR